MAKRRFISETPLPGEKARLHHQVNPDEQISDTHALDSLPLPLANPEPRTKRKRTTDPQSDTLEEVEIKRARKNSSEPPDPEQERNSGPELWPGVHDILSKGKPVWFNEECLRSYHNFLLSEKAYNESYNEDNMLADELNPSPELSDSDAAEGDEQEIPTTSPEQTQHPIPILRHSDSEQDSDSEQGSDSEQDPEQEQNSGFELWPSVQDIPSKGKPVWFNEECLRSYHNFFHYLKKHITRVTTRTTCQLMNQTHCQAQNFPIATRLKAMNKKSQLLVLNKHSTLYPF
ncbi:uncharacterized protein TrAtP1_001261 [Trichoderma atroviride]|uniref:uncharacterized protein n=1 Tax=Hypocrea atroviridis TaxID=63577 RepID=UPI00332E9495|nr:hypothetical protein TrAtP1_001261 [Trichoderma atroviride]